MKPNFYALIVISLLISCNKEVVINVPPDKPIPVMNTIITFNSTFVVDLSYSIPILESNGNFKSIRDASVSLFVNDRFIEKLDGKETEKSFQYLSSFKPKQGEQIRIEAKINNDVLKGGTIIPTSPEIGAGKAFQTVSDAFGNKEFRIDFFIKDKKTQNDFYRLRIFQIVKDSIDFQSPLFFTIENIKNKEGGIFDDFVLQEQSSAHFFDDYSFNGQNFNLMMKSKGQHQLEKIAIELSSISKETYLYFKSIQLQKRRNEDPLYEKVTLFSNVINGLGIVGSVNRTFVQQVFEK